MLTLPPGCLCVSAVAAALCRSPAAVWTDSGLHLTAYCHMSLNLNAYTIAASSEGRWVSDIALSAVMHLLLQGYGARCL